MTLANKLIGVAIAGAALASLGAAAQPEVAACQDACERAFDEAMRKCGGDSACQVKAQEDLTRCMGECR